MGKTRILLADSSPFSLELMKGFLKESAITLLTAADSAALLQLARRQRPHLIVVDHALAGDGGLTCCRELGTLPHAPPPTILLISGSQPEQVAAGLDAGASAVLSKPLDRRVFLETGRALLATIDRREPRIPCRATVAYRDAGNTFYGTIEDLSANGMFIGTPRSVAIGTQIEIKFLLPWHEARLIATKARVAWVNDPKQRRKSLLFQGFGVEFIDLLPGDADLIADFITYSHLRQNPPEDW